MEEQRREWWILLECLPDPGNFTSVISYNPHNHRLSPFYWLGNWGSGQKHSTSQTWLNLPWALPHRTTLSLDTSCLLMQWKKWVKRLTHSDARWKATRTTEMCRPKAVGISGLEPAGPIFPASAHPPLPQPTVGTQRSPSNTFSEHHGEDPACKESWLWKRSCR